MNVKAMKFQWLFPLFVSLLFINCQGQTTNTIIESITPTNQAIVVGAEQLSVYLPKLKDKRVALVVNQTSVIRQTHLLDTLISSGVAIDKVFAPEHGFRGKADAGEKVLDGVDATTGTTIVSLYGSHKKPTPKDLENVDLVIFDIQDVGVRFYTYISTLHLVMEACAENKVPLLVLDRPNPNGHYVDGYVREEEYKSFIGMHPVPIVHGMTIGEYAQMLNGEKWLENGVQCDLEVIACVGYNHLTEYHLPIKPSPNLPNAVAINWYPSICFFEGTNVSVGRGTDWPFQCYGSPLLNPDLTTFSFMPAPNEGAKQPKLQGEECFGFKVDENVALKSINLQPLMLVYDLYPNKKDFFLSNGFFELLAGTKRLRLALQAGKTDEEIKAEWEQEVMDFKLIRSKYLLYTDFE